MKYLLDTTWVVEYLRGNPRIVSRIQGLHREGLAMSAISVAELYEGVFRSSQPEANEKALQDFISAVEVLEVTEDVARRYGQQRVGLLQQGRTMGALDLLIAATAQVHNLTLLTHDQDFQRAPGLRFESS